MENLSYDSIHNTGYWQLTAATALYTTRRDHLDAPRPLPGSGQAKSSTTQPLDSCRTPLNGRTPNHASHLMRSQ